MHARKERGNKMIESGLMDNIQKQVLALEDAIASVLEQSSDIESMADEWLYSYTQNANEQELEFGRKPIHYRYTLDLFERFTDALNDATNDVTHGYDTVADRLVNYIDHYKQRMACEKGKEGS